jgi:hypothetical protein
MYTSGWPGSFPCSFSFWSATPAASWRSLYCDTASTPAAMYTSPWPATIEFAAVRIASRPEAQ